MNSKILASAAALAALPAIVAAKSVKPNVIFILTDDQGYGDVSALNESSRIRTPNLDSLCGRGVVFTDAHSGSSVSTPTRYGIMTGRYAFRSSLKRGVLNGYSRPLIPPERKTMAGMFSDMGYSTACIGKWHLGWNWGRDEAGLFDFSQPITGGPTRNGFDYFFGICGSLDMAPYVYVENDRPTAVPVDTIEASKGLQMYRKGPIAPDFKHMEVQPNFTRRALDYIASHKDADRPFFLYFPMSGPHTPILPTPEFQGASGLSPYGDFVMMIDDMVGQIVRALKASGLYDDTIIVFTSDNGCSPAADINFMKRHGHNPNYIFRGSKSDLYDGGHRIPLIVVWGDRYNGRREDGLVCLTDFFRTFADMTGYAVPDNEAEDSYSIWNVLDDGHGHPRRDYVVHHSIDGEFAIRDKRWKLLLANYSGGWGTPSLKEAQRDSLPAVQLFDMKKDVRETMNVCADSPARVERMKRLMARYIVEGRSTPGAPQENDKAGAWKQIEKIVK